jgi:hypothetical protein
MKKSLLLIVFVTVVFTSKAQMWCSSGSIWHCDGVLGLQPSIITQTYLKDTLVSGINYNKLYLVNQETGSTYSVTANVYTFTQNNIVLFNAPNITLASNPIDTLIYFGTIGSKWHPRLRLGGNCAKSFIQITDTGTANIQGQFLKWKKINYKNYYTFGTTDSTTASGTDTIFEHIGFKKISFLYNHCSDFGGIDITTFRCFNDNNISVSSIVNQTCAGVSTSTTNINEPIKKINSIVYPNPANDVLNIEFSTSHELTEQPITIEITNTLGQLVLQEKMINLQPSLNIQHLQSGVYYLCIKTKDETITRKIMIQK